MILKILEHTPKIDKGDFYPLKSFRADITIYVANSFPYTICMPSFRKIAVWHFPSVTCKKEKVNDSENTKSTIASNVAVNQEHQILLATALVNLNSEERIKSIRALLDNGSQSCFIMKACCKELELNPRDMNIPVCGIGRQSIQTRSRYNHHMLSNNWIQEEMRVSSRGQHYYTRLLYKIFPLLE